MKLLKSEQDVKLFNNAVDKCSGEVVLRSMDGREELNLKSQLSRFIAIGKLCQDNGDEYEVFCLDRNDIGHLLGFFSQIHSHNLYPAITT